MITSFFYVYRVFNFNENKVVNNVLREEVSDHPLKPLGISVSECIIARRFGSSTASSIDSATPTRTPTHIVLDPLGAALDGTDPLSQFARLDSESLGESELDSVSFIVKNFYFATLFLINY